MIDRRIYGQKKIFYRGTNDQVFKAIFCKDENRRLLRRLIEDAFEVKGVIILGVVIPELPKDNIYQHGKILDVIVKMNGQITNIEINVYDDPIFHRRNFAYIAYLYATQLRKGKNYATMQNFAQLNLTVSFSFDIPPFDIYELRGKKYGKLFIDNLTIREFNLLKLDDPCYNKFKFIKMLNDGEQELNEECIGDKDMEKFNEEIHRVNSDPEFSTFISPEDDERQFIDTVKAVEFTNGLEQGIEQGSINEKLNIANNLLAMNIPINDIIKATGLSKEQVESLE